MKRSLVRFLLRVVPPSTRRVIRTKLLPSRLAARIGKAVGEVQRQSDDSDRKQTAGYPGRMWGGFSEEAISDLERERDSFGSPRTLASASAVALSAWYLGHGKFKEAHLNALIARVANPHGASRNLGQQLLEADSLVWIGKNERARELLEGRLANNPGDPHLLLALANTYATPTGSLDEESDRARLAILNGLLSGGSLVPIRLRDPDGPLTLKNIITPPVEPTIPVQEQAKVSVLIPAHRAADTLPVALDSLLAQTWKNLEIIVVDDVSPDETFSIATRYAERDARVIAVQQPENRGAYAARNAALRISTGEFVTVHDADDWSHPQKLEYQIRALLLDSSVLASESYWVRCFENLFFRGMARPGSHWVMANVSSLLMRRETILALGGWDEVRIAADNEFRRRLEHNQPEGSIVKVLPGVPLSLSLEQISSLTRQSATHVHTVHYGVRKVYHEAAKRWLSTQTGHFPRLPSDGSRAFPAPPMILPERARLELDVLFIMETNLPGGAFVSTWNYVQAAIAAGLRVGLFHYRRYDLGVRSEMPSVVTDAIDSFSLSQVAPGQEVKTRAVLVGYPVILRTPIDLPPVIQCEFFGILNNQMATRLYSGGDVQYDPRQIVENVERLFGKKPVWIPISDLVRRLMTEDTRYEAIHFETWNPLIAASKRTASYEWRGGNGGVPKVGRHGRDHYTKWPTNPDAIRAAYCAQRPCEVRILGGAEHAIALLGTCPSNWTVEAYGARDASSFLSELDFFIHFPHEDYIEEFGRAVLEAMAAGVPAILPPVFEATFGDAALYAEPDGVWPLIERLWGDESAWIERAKAGVAFAEARDWGAFAERYKRLLPPGQTSEV